MWIEKMEYKRWIRAVDKNYTQLNERVDINSRLWVKERNEEEQKI